MASGAAGLTKAMLRVVDGQPDHTELQFLFNPTEYSVSKGASWSRKQVKAALSSSKPEFSGTEPQTIQLEIFFDDYEQRSGNIADDVATLLEWTRPTTDSVNKGEPQPPILSFQWGANKALTQFRGYLKSVSAKYSLFDPSGKVLRATANITLEEVPTDAKGTNPTSGGELGLRRHVLREGESLQSVAYLEYGDPTLWRALARFNAIDDPLRVPVGRSVLIPHITDTDRLG